MEVAVRRAGLIAIAICVMSVPAAAMDAKFKAVLKTLDPSIRLEQICDAEAMTRIGKDRNPYRPDRAMIGALSQPSVVGDTIAGSGGAFRSKGKWYAFSFTCQAAPDRLSILSFDYRVGQPIPEEKWSDYGLYQ